MGCSQDQRESERRERPRLLLKPDSRLLKSIHQGRPNTAMDAWKSKPSDEAIRDVLAYVLTFPR